MGGLPIDFGLINADNVEQVSFGVAIYIRYVVIESYDHFSLCHFYPHISDNTILHLTYIAKED